MSPINAVLDTVYNFASNDISITGTTLFSRAPRSNQLEERAFADGAIMVGSTIRSKPLNLEGRIRANSAAELEGKIDTLQTYLMRRTLSLDMVLPVGTRRYEVVPGAFEVRREGLGASVADYTVEFTVPSGHGLDRQNIVLFSNVVAAASGTIEATCEGTYDVLPTLMTDILSIDPGSTTLKTFKWSNPTNLSTISVTGYFKGGDRIVFDCATQIAKVNGVKVRAIGAWPRWEPGLCTFSYSDTASSRSVVHTGSYLRRYV